MPTSNNHGFGLMEIVVAIAIATIALYGMSETARLSYRYVNDATKKLQASFLLEESVEAVKILRDQGWSTHIASLATSSPYYLAFTGGTWQVSTANIFVDDTFERRFQLEPVIRNASDDIAVSGTIDPDTRKLTVTISWRSGVATTSQTISTYITNLFQN